MDMHQDVDRVSPVFYLKINTHSTYAMRCFWHWVDIVEAYGASFYIVCDNRELATLLSEDFAQRAKSSATPVDIIGSIHEDDALSLLPDVVTDRRWLRVAYALLTPYLHASAYGFPEIWNIDADDSYLFASPEDCALLLQQMARDIKRNGYQIGSVDFHYSLHYPQRVHWSFGISYSPNYLDIKHLLELADRQMASWLDRDDWFVGNIDEVFNNLTQDGYLKLGIYGFNNVTLRHALQTAVRWHNDHLDLLNCATHRLIPYEISASQILEGKIELPPEVKLIGLDHLISSSHQWNDKIGGDDFAFGNWRLQSYLRQIPSKTVSNSVVSFLPRYFDYRRYVSSSTARLRRVAKKLRQPSVESIYGFSESHPITFRAITPLAEAILKTPNSLLAPFLGKKFADLPYYNEQRELPTLDNAILYESFFGRRVSDSPLAIFRHIVNDKRFQNFEHIWIIDHLDVNETPAAPFANVASVHFVEKGSRDYYKYLARSKFLVNDTHFPDFFIKRPTQIYINTWHGTTLKHLGKDIVPVISGHLTEIQRNFNQADYLIEPNLLTSNVIRHAFYLDRVSNSKMLLTGYPRIDTILNTDRNSIRRRLGVRDDETLFSYFPTYRATKMQAEKDAEERHFLHRVETLSENLPPNSKLAVRSHHMLHALSPTIREMDVPEDIDTNELLAATDVLITDYSSVFFDFLVTRRPIIFYCDDLDDYLTKWGTYLPMDNLPGPLCQNDNEVINALASVRSVDPAYNSVYEQFILDFCPYDTGNASEVIAQLILGNAPTRLIDLNNGKPNVLVCPGDLSESHDDAIEESRSLDYDSTNVVYLIRSTASNRARILDLDPRANVVLYHYRSPFVTGDPQLRRDYFTYLFGSDRQSKLSEPLMRWFRDEASYLFGSIKFASARNYAPEDRYIAALASVIDMDAGSATRPYVPTLATR